MSCKICQSSVEPLFRKTILGKHEIQYSRCTRCGCIQTEEPYWLGEAYSDAVSDVDLGSINRAMVGARTVESIILTMLDANGKYIDWGGGFGIFTRLMRDVGYDFYWRDIYCENLFAKQFVAAPGERYELLTAFEVFEHLVDPMTGIDEMLACSSNIFFTTLLVPPSVSADWWYFAPDTGQHIVFYTPAALATVADRFGLHLCSDGAGNHLLSKEPQSQRLFQLLVRDGRTANLLRRLQRKRYRKQSLLVEDFRAVSGWNV